MTSRFPRRRSASCSTAAWIAAISAVCGENVKLSPGVLNASASPSASFAKAAVDVWTSAAGFTSGRVFRPVNKGGNLAGDSMTAQSIFETVNAYAAGIGMGDIAPHDLRRSFAKLAHKGRAALEQIQLSLGHASIQTTERYLGVQQDLNDAPCDHLGLKLSGNTGENNDGWSS